MHCAMIHLLLENFPRYMHFLRGWHAVPLDLLQRTTPLRRIQPGLRFRCLEGCRHPPPRVAAGKLRRRLQLGVFLRTIAQPIAADPLVRNPDPETGEHKYLHSR